MVRKKIENEIWRLIKDSKEEMRKQNFESSWLKLAEGHILSQPFARLHIIVHWYMLRLAFKEKNLIEITGQFLRLLIAGPGSLVKLYPPGNSGRSNVSMFAAQEIPLELKKKIEQLNQ